MTQASQTSTELNIRSPQGLYVSPSDGQTIPIHLMFQGHQSDIELSTTDKRWMETCEFKGKSKSHLFFSKPDGSLSSVLLGGGFSKNSGEPCGPSDLLLGYLTSKLPDATYHLGEGFHSPELACLSWGLGGYKFQHFKSGKSANRGGRQNAQLLLPSNLDKVQIESIIEAIWFARDLINTPASHCGPSELETAIRLVGERYGAEVRAIVGDQLLVQKFNLIHAVGRGSPRTSRLIELNWRKPHLTPSALKITLVGKGITFDTGGLDLKPASAMLLMKKDMGGAAVALAVAHMIMAAQLDVELRLLIPSAENSVSGDSFRPGDIVNSRSGKTIEIGNTDAEGRLILADALDFADETPSDILFIFATLTGAARTALGPDLPALFCNDDLLASHLTEIGNSIGDPVWRLPLWSGYDRHLESDIADYNNVWESPFAGSITAALFLQKFLSKTKRFAHFDLYGWRPSSGPLGPKGGEAQTARTVFEVVRRESEKKNVRAEN